MFTSECLRTSLEPQSICSNFSHLYNDTYICGKHLSSLKILPPDRKLSGSAVWVGRSRTEHNFLKLTSSFILQKLELDTASTRLEPLYCREFMILLTFIHAVLCLVLSRYFIMELHSFYVYLLNIIYAFKYYQLVYQALKLNNHAQELFI